MKPFTYNPECKWYEHYNEHGELETLWIPQGQLNLVWECGRCHNYLLDADEVKHPGHIPNGITGIEPKEYWLGDDPICNGCAQELRMVS